MKFKRKMQLEELSERIIPIARETFEKEMHLIMYESKLKSLKEEEKETIEKQEKYQLILETLEIIDLIEEKAIKTIKKLVENLEKEAERLQKLIIDQESKIEEIQDQIYYEANYLTSISKFLDGLRLEAEEIPCENDDIWIILYIIWLTKKWEIWEDVFKNPKDLYKKLDEKYYEYNSVIEFEKISLERFFKSDFEEVFYWRNR